MKKVFLEHIKKEGRVYIILLALLLVAAFVLRVMNLTGLEPYSDEGSHLISALEINDHGKPTVVLNGMETTGYFRVYALSYLLAFLFALFGKSLFIARLPGVIISTLTIVPFYFFGPENQQTHRFNDGGAVGIFTMGHRHREKYKGIRLFPISIFTHWFIFYFCSRAPYTHGRKKRFSNHNGKNCLFFCFLFASHLCASRPNVHL